MSKIPNAVTLANELLEAADAAQVNRVCDAMFDTMKDFPPNMDALLAVAVIVGKGIRLLDHGRDVQQLTQALHLIILNEATGGSMNKTKGNA